MEPLRTRTRVPREASACVSGPSVAQVSALHRRVLEQGPADGRMSPRGDHRHPTPVFDGLPTFLEWKRCKPRRICTELHRFWNADCPQTRMDAHSEHRAVTPGVAGSSPVHSANT